MMEDIYDVAIVGAGLSGLSAARVLHKAGLNVIVLEAAQRVGGRLLAGKSPKTGVNVDLGGAFVHPYQERIIQLAKDLGIETYLVYDEGKVAVEYNGKVYVGNDTPSMGISQSLDLNRAIVWIDNTCQKIDVQNASSSPLRAELRNISVAGWIDKEMRAPMAKALVNLLIEGQICRPTEHISMFDFFIRGQKNAGV